MSTLSHKIDFAIVLRVKNANPNGDPLNGNRPRTDYAGLGEITDVCLKRKIRDRMVERYQTLAKEQKEGGQAVFVQSNESKIDDFKCLRDRAEATLKGVSERGMVVKKACETWLDVRCFGQLFAFTEKKGKSKKNTTEEDGNSADASVSVGIRGPVTIQSAFSTEPVSVSSNQITKSVNGEGDSDVKKSPDTMGMKHRVDSAVYVTFGSMNPQLAERTGFSDADAETIKAILPKLFENDASSARPEGSMEVLEVVWWKHASRSGQCSSAKVHGSLSVGKDGKVELKNIDGLVPEQLPGY